MSTAAVLGRRTTSTPGSTGWTVTLAAAVAAAGAWAVMSADWSDGTGVALVAAAAAVVLAACVARSPAGRVTATLAAPVLGLLVIVPLTLRAVPGGLQGWGHVVTTYAGALTGGLFATSDWPFDVGLAAGLWLAGYWLGWLAVRERRAVLALLPWLSVLAVNDLNAPSLDHVALPEAVALAAALLLLVRVEASERTARWRRTRVIALPGTERRSVRIGGVAALLLLVLALLVPPVSSRDVSSLLFRGGTGGGQHPGGTGASGGAPRTGRVQFAPATEPGQPLVSDPRPVLTYTSDSDAPIYLGVVADTVMSAGNWYPQQAISGSATVPVKGGTLPRGGEVTPALIPRDPEGLGAQQQRVGVKIVLKGDATGGEALALFPGDPAATSAGGHASGSPSSTDGELVTVDAVSLSGSPATLDTQGFVSTASEDQLRAAGNAYPAWVTDYQYLQLPDQTAFDQEEVRVLGRIAADWTRGASDAYDRAALIEQHLRDPKQFTYTLKPPASAASSWVIVDFLTRTHQGYCQYFASAMGALLRAAGIPARLMSGYGPGSANDNAGGHAGFAHTVTTSDAHIWPQAFFPGYGWVAFEPTPDGTYTPLSRGGASGADAAPATSTPLPSASAPAKPAPTQAGRASAADSGQVTVDTAPTGLVAGLLALLLVGGALVGGLAWMARPRTIVDLWRRIDILARALGVHRMAAETHADFARRLAAALPLDTTTLRHRDGSAELGPRPVRQRAFEALRLIADVSGKDAFAPQPLTPRETMQWRHAWDRLRHVAPRLVWRSMLARSAGVRSAQPPREVFGPRGAMARRPLR